MINIYSNSWLNCWWTKAFSITNVLGFRKMLDRNIFSYLGSCAKGISASSLVEFHITSTWRMLGNSLSIYTKHLEERDDRIKVPKTTLKDKEKRKQFLHQYRQSNKEEKMTEHVVTFQITFTISYHHKAEKRTEHSPFICSDHQHGG